MKRIAIIQYDGFGYYDNDCEWTEQMIARSITTWTDVSDEDYDCVKVATTQPDSKLYNYRVVEQVIEVQKSIDDVLEEARVVYEKTIAKRKLEEAKKQKRAAEKQQKDLEIKKKQLEKLKRGLGE